MKRLAALRGVSVGPAGFSTGVLWNFASLVFLAAAGFALNIVIGRIYGPEPLGVFNICFGLFVFLSQFGSFGLQFSVLQAMAARDQDAEQAVVDRIVVSGLLSTTATSTLATLIGLAATPVIGAVFDAPGIVMAWLAILPGLWAFSINKYLFGVINGARKMRAFAVLQSLRYILMLAALTALAVAGAPGHLLTVVFTAAELLLTPALFLVARRSVSDWRGAVDRDWARRHLSFGSRSFLSGAILELNTRVDVLMIGAWLDASKAGIYTAALLVAEGMSQAVFALRNNVNPVIARHLAEGDDAALLQFSRRVGLAFTAFMTCAALVAVALYPFYVEWALGGGAFQESRASATILILGLAAASGFLCFAMILVMGEKPAAHTIYVGAVLAVNIVLNAAFIPRWGIEGAASATAISYGVAAIGAAVAARRILGRRIIL